MTRDVNVKVVTLLI